jgi:hypothetical protein
MLSYDRMRVKVFAHRCKRRIGPARYLTPCYTVGWLCAFLDALLLQTYVCSRYNTRRTGLSFPTLLGDRAGAERFPLVPICTAPDAFVTRICSKRSRLDTDGLLENVAFSEVRMYGALRGSCADRNLKPLARLVEAHLRTLRRAAAKAKAILQRV